jgi:peptidyl-dipeptidase Dcp
MLLLALAVTFFLSVNFMNFETNVRAFGETNNKTVADESNPLLAGWAGPYGGIPPFDKVQISQFKPALEAAMNENLAEIDKIADEKSAPTFENTIAALERTGSALDRVQTVYGIWAGTMSSPDMRAVEREMGPKFAAINDKITQNEALFKRIEAVYNTPEKSKLTPEAQRLTWRYYTNFVRAGARLGAA